MRACVFGRIVTKCVVFLWAPAQLEHFLFIGVAFDDCVVTGGVTHPVPTAVFAIFQVTHKIQCTPADDTRATGPMPSPGERNLKVAWRR